MIALSSVFFAQSAYANNGNDSPPGQVKKETPQIDFVIPSSGYHTGGDFVVITGKNFDEDSSVLFDATPARSVFFIGKKVLLVVTPAFDVAGSVDVTVANDSDKSDTLADGFNFLDEPVEDNDAPTVFVQSLAGSGAEPYVDNANDASTSLVLNATDEDSGVASCRFSTSNVEYAFMTDNCNTPTGDTIACALGSLPQASHSYYYACADKAGNVTAQQKVDFTVDWVDQVTGVSATDGDFNDKVRVSWNADSAATGYEVNNGTGWIDVGNVTSYDDTNAPAPAITPGTTSASDGTSFTYVELTSSGNTTSQGAVASYMVRGHNSNGDGPESISENGNRSVGALAHHWQVSADDSDGGYLDIPGATTSTYLYTDAPADGVGRYYRAIISAEGAEQIITAGDRGFRTSYTANTIEEPDQAMMQQEYEDGRISTEDPTPTATSAATFYADYSFVSQVVKVEVLPETTMTPTGGGTLNLYQFDVTDITDQIRSVELPKIKAAVHIGFSDHRLTFSQPITISLNVGSFEDGTVLEITYRNAGETVWNHETYCTVENGLCVFQSIHATDFAAGPGPLAVHESTQTQMDVDATIALACSDSVIMGAITGDGRSDLATNNATCNVRTNSSSGYKLEWLASTATMNSGSNTIAGYSPNTANIPNAWSINSADSEWGAKLMSSSTTYDSATWGAVDTYTGGKWLNVDAAAPFQFIARPSETADAGDNENLLFGADIGTDHIQPTGTYNVDVAITATTL